MEMTSYKKEPSRKYIFFVKILTTDPEKVKTKSKVDMGYVYVA